MGRCVLARDVALVELYHFIPAGAVAKDVHCETFAEPDFACVFAAQNKIGGCGEFVFAVAPLGKVEIALDPSAGALGGKVNGKGLCVVWVNAVTGEDAVCDEAHAFVGFVRAVAVGGIGLKQSFSGDDAASFGAGDRHVGVLQALNGSFYGYSFVELSFDGELLFELDELGQ